MKIKADLKLRATYKCSVCGKEVVGTTIYANYIAHSSEELKTLIDNIRPTSSHMPIGWCYGVDNKFRCEMHIHN